MKNNILIINNDALEILMKFPDESDVATRAADYQQRKAVECGLSLKNRELGANFAAAYRMLSPPSEEK